ncbi:MAG: hypothetical protein ILP19_09200 [Oscillospiraceae bacterium]|nr:hypothetical protein [Oscillospiraceae bacterium]
MSIQNQTAIFLAVLGAFPYIMNWVIFIHNKRGGKWSSQVPPVGGLLFIIAGLVSTVKPLALIGLADPSFFLIAEAVVSGIKDALHTKEK